MKKSSLFLAAAACGIISVSGIFSPALAQEGQQAVVVEAAANTKASDKEMAIADYTQAIKLDPKNAENYFRRGNAYSLQKKYDLAIADYDQTIKLASSGSSSRNNRDLSHAYDNRGIAYDCLQKYDLALADYNQAILLNPNNAQAYNNRGLRYYNEKKV